MHFKGLEKEKGERRDPAQSYGVHKYDTSKPAFFDFHAAAIIGFGDNMRYSLQRGG